MQGRPYQRKREKPATKYGIPRLCYLSEEQDQKLIEYATKMNCSLSHVFKYSLDRLYSGDQIPDLVQRVDSIEKEVKKMTKYFDLAYNLFRKLLARADEIREGEEYEQ